MENQTSILVVDDEQIICESCQRILSSEDFRVDTDTNPVAGIEKALANHYDLILLDLNMSELDGMQFLAKLRKEKPEVPVIIITGYPTKETKDESRNLGVSEYILKPFKPSEILEPVMNIIKSHIPARKKDMIEIDLLEASQSFKPESAHCLFFKNSWLQQSASGLVRVGGQFPVLLNEAVESIRFAPAGEHIYRGFPLAQVTFANDITLTIPSPVSGKIIALNDSLAAQPSVFEDAGKEEGWIATMLPDNPAEDLMMCEERTLVLLSKDSNDTSKYMQHFDSLGYLATMADSAENTLSLLEKEAEKVVVVDAKSFGEQGPQLVKIIREKSPEAKVIVFNASDTGLETQYREHKVFYYAVDPIARKEISSIVYGAYCFAKDKEPMESKMTTFLPTAINKVAITNKHGRKISLLAFDNVLHFNKSTGYLLLQQLHDKLFPVSINHTRYITRMKDPLSAQAISKEQIASDKILMLCKDEIGKIPGSISVTEETYANSNRPDNKLIKIAIQPEQLDTDEFNPDVNVARALAELIEKEMSSL
jgi:DNA-binding response OmpR family regulator/glycine cleavage system H lipoate-binding protein